jgi:lysozyme
MTASAEVLDELRRSNLPTEAQACLAALSEGEGATSFRSLYGGGIWEGSMAAFPDWPGAIGPSGQPTHAAGAWQDQPGTYADVAKITGITSFEPVAQITNNWALAQHDYHARSKRDLLADLQAGLINLVESQLVGTWPGGAGPEFTTRYADNLAALNTAPAPPAPSPVQGSDVVIDLYHEDDPVDFVQMKAAGIEAVILKCSQGRSFADPKFAERSVAAAAAGLLVGAYHFCNASPPDQQAQHFLSLAKGVSVLAIDVEPNDDGEGGTITVPDAATIADLVAQETGRKPLIYIGLYGPDGKGTGLPNPTLSSCPLWLSQYRNVATVPPGWDKWTLWQYTNTGQVAGAPTKSDRSRFAGSVGELHDWWAGATPSPDTLATLVKTLQSQLDAASATASKIAVLTQNHGEINA